MSEGKSKYEESLAFWNIGNISYTPVDIDGVRVGIEITRFHVLAQIGAQEFMLRCEHSGVKEKRPGTKKKCYVLDVSLSHILTKDGKEVSEGERALIKEAIKKHYEKPALYAVDFD